MFQKAGSANSKGPLQERAKPFSRRPVKLKVVNKGNPVKDEVQEISRDQQRPVYSGKTLHHFIRILK